MADAENNSLLGDILAASASAGGTTSQPPIPAVRTRNELEDFLRLSDEHWGIFLSSIAPDDLVVMCKSILPAWRNRVLASLDTASSDWLRANLAALDEVAPALLSEARGRAMANAKRLSRDGDIVLPEAPPAKPPGATSPAKSNTAPINAPTASANAAVTPTPAGDGLDVLFVDLMRLRQQSGVAALAALASDVPDPFLKSGLCLVAAGLPAQDLERALDGALARQAEAYLDQLAQMRTRLLALARG
jgi:FliG C-terminal domain